MLRNIIGVLFGLVLGMVANMIMVRLNSVLFPLPAGVNPEDMEAARAHYASLPPTAYLLPFLGHFSQVLVGGLVATKVGRASPAILVGIIGVLTILGSVGAIFMLKLPAWAWIELPLYVPVIWGTILLAKRLRGAPSAPAPVV